MADMAFPEEYKKYNLSRYEKNPVILARHIQPNIPVGFTTFQKHKPQRILFFQDPRSIAYSRGVEKKQYRLDPAVEKDSNGIEYLVEISVIVNRGGKRK